MNFPFHDVLMEELKAALGCTEPIAVALASAKARSLIEADVERIELYCSRNVIKNANSVVVPKTNGLKGIRIASAVGAIGGDATKGLEVLSDVQPVDIEAATQLIHTVGRFFVHAGHLIKFFLACLLDRRNRLEVAK